MIFQQLRSWTFKAGRVGLLSLVAACVGCAHRPSRESTAFPTFHAGNCAEFCEVIQSCASMTHHEELAGKLCRISRCETGNKCRGNLDSPNGLFHGPFQFLPATWNSQCHPIFSRRHLTRCLGRKAIQDTCCATICAAEMVARGGIGNWPVCGHRG